MLTDPAQTLNTSKLVLEIRWYDGGGSTIATMRHAQAARNPSVIAVLRQFGLTEDAGRGVDVLQDVMRDEMLDPPIFEEVADFVRVTLPIKEPITPEERAWLKGFEEGGRWSPPSGCCLCMLRGVIRF